MNNRILIQTDDENSTWNEQSQSCYIYHRSTGRWSTLTRFNNIHRTWFDRWRLSFNVLNDSLVSVWYGSSLDSIAVWNVDADSMMYKFENRFGGKNAVILQPLFGFVQYFQNETNHLQLLLYVTSLVDGASELRSVVPPGDSEYVKKIIPRNSGGFWLQTEDALWWTERFESYTRVMDLLTYDKCQGGIDGDRIHVLRFDPFYLDRATFITIMSPSHEPSIFSTRRASFDAFVGIDTANRAWYYRRYPDDGFYVASIEVPVLTRYSQFDKRTDGVSLNIGPDSWMASKSYRGLMISEDAGQTWEHVSLPHSTPQRIDASASIQSVEDGGVMLTSTIYYYRKNDSTNFEIVGTQSDGKWPSADRWYHRNQSWLRSNGSRVEVSDSRGILTQWSIFSTGHSYTFNYRDTVYVRWFSTNPDTALYVAKWIPGSSTLQADSAASQKFSSVFTVQPLTGRTVWFGGNGQQYSFSQTGKVENLQTVHLPEPLCSRDHSLLKAVVSSPDSLSLLMYHETSNCYVVLALPLKNLRSYNVRQQELPLAYNRNLITGHDQQLVGIFDNKAYILAPDMRSAALHDFVNVTEKHIIDIAYDDVNHVYYVLTERGLYRSDPVVTSVASEESWSDDHRPASGLPLQTTWYNTLGEQISPPTQPGLYFKVMLTDAGSMVTEKVLIN